MRLLKNILPGMLCLVLMPATAAAQQFQSGKAQQVMIELFTSEGCSSCPPAEGWLNALADEPGLWSDYVPLAFHVDYWDYLGWRDRYALPGNTGRQRLYAELRNLSTVYTPAFVVNGQGWRPGWLKALPRPGERQVGELSVTLEGRQFKAYFNAPDPTPAGLRLNLAVLGMGLETAIQAGENAGRAARHEFVVLSHQPFDAKTGQWEGRLRDWDSKGAQRLALAAWVSSPVDPTPLQATGGFLSSGPDER